jgi:spermidine synthase
MPVLLASFFVFALYYHWRLVTLRPPTTHLTLFYLWMALGGALGGLFNAVLVPVVFSFPVEFVLVAACAALWVVGDNTPALTARRLGAAMIAATFLFLLVSSWGGMLGSYRNFYGAVTVYDTRELDGETHRLLISGDGVQGSQRLTPYVELTPKLYFPPIAPVMARSEYKQIGMLGVGAGMALCFTAPERQFTVYEIDSKFRALAEEKFTYIRDCGAPVWKMGDGRLLLSEHAGEPYDLLMLDAFQGGHLPLHLITLEALRMYQSKVKPTGVILYNLNSRYFDLYPQLTAQAAATGWQIWRAPESWALLARYDNDVSWLAAHGWTLMLPRNIAVWQDDRANPLSALRILSRP